MTLASAPVYHDLQGLAALKSQAQNTPKEALAEAAKQFEALFTQMMLKSMRDATIEGGLFDSSQMETYQSMFDQQLSLDLSRGDGLGLANILLKELGGESAASKSVAEQANVSRALLQSSDAPAAIPVANPLAPVAPASSRAAPLTPEAAKNTVATGPAVGKTTASEIAQPATPQQRNWRPGSPEEFVRGVWDHAVGAARELGLDPLVLVAQSALETGWGKRMIQAVDGSSSFNLFGIKSGDSWQGDSAAVKSVEFRDGVAVLERASFRVYDSVAKSFDDYVSFLKSNPRYEQALEKVADAGQFLHELQDAGYATDPAYAQKILGIIGSAAYAAVTSELKNI